MRFFVKAKPGAKEDHVERIDATHFSVRVKARAEDGRANAAIEQALAGYLALPPSRVKIIRGQGSRKKIVEVVA